MPRQPTTGETRPADCRTGLHKTRHTRLHTTLQRYTCTKDRNLEIVNSKRQRMFQVTWGNCNPPHPPIGDTWEPRMHNKDPITGDSYDTDPDFMFARKVKRLRSDKLLLKLTNPNKPFMGKTVC